MVKGQEDKRDSMQFIDLQAQYAALNNEIDIAIQKVLNHAQFIMGPEVAELENEIGQYLNIKHVITCANGTDALQLLYMAYGIGEGDAVFAPDITFVATVESAAMLGATPVFCDVTRENFNLCPQSLEKQIKAVIKQGKLCPRAVVAVDFLGTPAAYEELQAIATKYEMIFIEDAAQSFGAEYKGKKCGALGDSAATSFFPAKPLGCYGDGGAVMTNDDAIAELCRSLRVHGKGASKYENVRIGLNSRLDTIQAAVLRVKLKALREYEMDRRQKIAARYSAALGDRFLLLQVVQGCRSTYAQYALLAENKKERDAILDRLKGKGIPGMVYYPYPQHVLEVNNAVEHYDETFAVSTEYCDRTLSLPMHPYLEQDVQDGIIQAVLEVEA